MGRIKETLLEFEYQETLNEKYKRIEGINETLFCLRPDYPYDFYNIGLEHCFNIKIKED